jgi:type I restriction enzyme S subunit
MLLPPLPEQRKIAAILSSVDEAIDKTQAVIDQVEIVKKAMMQDLLTKGLPGRHTRFKKTEIGMVPEEWEVVPLGDLLESIDSGWSPQCESVPATGDAWAVLKVSAVTSGSYRETEQKALPKNLEPRLNAEVMAGDVLLARANGVLDLVGRTVLVRNTRPHLMLSDKLLRLRPIPSRVHGPFLNIAMATDSVRERLLSTTGGSHMRNVSQTNLRVLLLPVPPLKEQVEVSGALDALDHRSESERRALDGLMNTKSALMSVLLTGEVRVTPEEGAA